VIWSSTSSLLQRSCSHHSALSDHAGGDEANDCLGHNAVAESLVGITW
jgi:hypothetical protein